MELVTPRSRNYVSLSHSLRNALMYYTCSTKTSNLICIGIHGRSYHLSHQSASLHRPLQRPLAVTVSLKILTRIAPTSNISQILLAPLESSKVVPELPSGFEDLRREKGRGSAVQAESTETTCRALKCTLFRPLWFAGITRHGTEAWHYRDFLHGGDVAPTPMLPVTEVKLLFRIANQSSLPAF